MFHRALQFLFSARTLLRVLGAAGAAFNLHLLQTWNSDWKRFWVIVLAALAIAAGSAASSLLPPLVVRRLLMAALTIGMIVLTTLLIDARLDFAAEILVAVTGLTAAIVAVIGLPSGSEKQVPLSRSNVLAWLAVSAVLVATTTVRIELIDGASFGIDLLVLAFIVWAFTTKQNSVRHGPQKP